MAEKIKYDVKRSMQGDKDYNRGDTRMMTEADAAPLVATGALVRHGEKPGEREPAVRHTFGAEPNEDRGYTDALDGKATPATDATAVREPSVQVTRVASDRAPGKRAPKAPDKP